MSYPGRPARGAGAGFPLVKPPSPWHGRLQPGLVGRTSTSLQLPLCFAARLPRRSGRPGTDHLTSGTDHPALGAELGRRTRPGSVLPPLEFLTEPEARQGTRLDDHVGRLHAACRKRGARQITRQPLLSASEDLGVARGVAPAKACPTRPDTLDTFQYVRGISRSHGTACAPGSRARAGMASRLQSTSARAACTTL